MHLIHEIISIFHFFKGQKINFKDELEIKYDETLKEEEKLNTVATTQLEDNKVEGSDLDA